MIKHCGSAPPLARGHVDSTGTRALTSEKTTVSLARLRMLLFSPAGRPLPFRAHGRPCRPASAHAPHCAATTRMGS